MRTVTATIETPDPDGTFDPAHRHHLTSTPDVIVDYTWELTEDGTVAELRRTVWANRIQMRHRVILWQEAAAVVPVSGLSEMVKDLVSCAAFGTVA